MTKARLARSTSRHRAPSRRDIIKPALFDLNEQVRDIVAPLELELRHAELDEFVPQLVDIMWTFVGALARAQGIRMPTGTLPNDPSATPEEQS
jgi:hypothetical protein